jgi:hypothetical protein
MLCLGNYTIRIERGRRAPVTPYSSRHRGARMAVLAGVAIAAAAIGAPVAFAAPVQAAGSGSTSLTINVVPSTLSISVSQGSETFGNCQGGTAPTASTTNALGFPNGTCAVGTLSSLDSGGVVPITITNGAVASDVDVNGSSAGNEGGNWGLCNPGGIGAAPTCSGTATLPGSDQFEMQNFTDSDGSDITEFLGLDPICDQTFDYTSPGSNGCSAGADEVQNEGVTLVGPQSTTDPGASFTTSVTWTAVAQ